jgi:outer membrane protein assembly factor BamB
VAADGGKVFVEQFGTGGAAGAVAYALDTGEEVWRTPLTEPAAGKKGPRLPPRFSGVMGGGRWCVSVSEAGTFGLDPATGKVAWKTADVAITRRTRVAARDGVLVVFAGDGDHALDARTGVPLWKGASKGSSYTQALTDRYLESKGQQGVYPTATCAWPVYANGYWYSHESYSSAHGANSIAALRDTPGTEIGLLGPKLIAWKYSFLSNACPSPTPAYGRLYYSPSSEGVVYCFDPTEK